MELKNIISQALDEIEQVEQQPKAVAVHKTAQTPPAKQNPKALQEEQQFLKDLEQKTLLLFEGLKSPQTKNLPMKLDLVVNYLQYQLYMVQERLKSFKD
ncbi:CiaD-like domain-containing protein [Helicobacter heilmannii]|uniref:Campylobacter invasion antigen D C-terminal domain-containing protein n=1 Tax=Helicobacter heilmannii TaxID=35817 RepID=A0A0K2XTS8_HELHE|nr:hypothetical protein [Helicobacter heilmannii]CCM11499.1 hypothetical protein BN341_12430 [Helicobacter heilmannii ASB1.4]CRF45904.1 hypothetical protein HHE014_08850 [Helicobacter heilmannii]CRF46744.1 hypothetical protein HHE02_00060 [Helicobacter heilmannii]CRF49512.1 hypothetical protein HHE03_11310 [Helicobacter heilmannii]CRF50949.1 hypothetical protein HHE06_08080 [Helicobacter heilmannii]